MGGYLFENESHMKKQIAFLAIFSTSFSLTGQSPDEVLQEEVAEFTSMELLETWGFLLSERFNLGGLEITDAEVDAISRGMKRYVNREDPPTDLSKSLDPMQNYFSEREEMVRQDQMKRNREEELEFFDSIVGQPGYQSLATGLYFQIIEKGSDRKPGKNDKVSCHYVGTFLDGVEFDSSYKRNEPSEFVLNSVIPGWTQGLQLIGEGGKVKLYVPAKLGYGDQGTPGVPPASALIFEVELLKVLGPDPAALGLPPIPQ